MSVTLRAATVCSIVEEIDAITVSHLTTESVRHALEGLAHVTAWVESQKLLLTRRLQELAAASPSVVPAQVIASASGVTRSEAQRGVARVSTLALVPQLETALTSGTVSIAHIDAVTQAMSHLSDPEKQKVAEQGNWINMVASHTTPDNFARAVRRAVQQVHSDSGLTQLEQQRRRTFLRHWVDRDSGMVCLRGEFDPESGLQIVGRLQNAVERLFREGTVNGESRSPDQLRALSLCALVVDTNTDSAAPITSAYGRADVSVIIDLKTLQSGVHKHSLVHTGTEIDVPIETIRRIACEAKIIPIVLGNDGVVLDVGRSSRLATRHQRRALESMHSTCAMPQCHIPVSQCQPHHIAFWNLGGATDMANLVPLCTEHHRCAHEGGWKLSLNASSRELTVREPGSARTRTAVPESVRVHSTGQG
jgi:hypothetical protein